MSDRPQKLTIGMAVYDDFDGVWFSLQALRTYHESNLGNKPRSIEYIVVDNNPTSNHGQAVESFVKNWVPGAKYIPMPEAVGTTQPREQVFQEATGNLVLCMDSHVLVEPEAIRKLFLFYEKNPDCMDLMSGPLVYDGLDHISTHFKPVWNAEMWGVWDTDERAKDPNGEAFPVWGQGLGLFTCRRDAWLGFNPYFRGFGAEEGYIHEKFRQAGRQCLCLPFLRWVHRFARPDGVKYPLTRWNKVRNYVLGHLELGFDLEPIHTHFVKSNLMSQKEWDHLVSNPVEAILPPGSRAREKAIQQMGAKRHGRPQPPDGSSLDQIFDWGQTIKRDLDQHLPALRFWARKVEHVTEFSKRRESTIAFASARPKVLISYQTEDDELLGRIHELIDGQPANSRRIDRFTTVRGGDSLLVDPIEPTDLLYIDTIHSAKRLREELERHGAEVSRAIIFRGTAHFGEVAEGSKEEGLNFAIREWLASHPDWFVAYHNSAQYGMTVISKHAEDKPAEELIPWPIGKGPGTELTKLLSSLSINPNVSCDCKAKAHMMDSWGVEGCKREKEKIVRWLQEGEGRWGWKDKLAAAGKAVANGLAWKLNPLDPFPGIVDEAIRRAEELEKQ